MFEMTFTLQSFMRLKSKFTHNIYGTTLFGLVLFGLGQSCYCEEALKTPAEFNNQGVRELNAKEFKKAIASFEEAIKLDPAYKLARENLAIAYNNLGLSVQDNPREALKYFHKGLFASLDSPMVQDNITNNIAEIITSLNKNPKSLNDRLELAQTALNEKDPEGAIIESRAALNLKENTKSRLLLFEAYKALGVPNQAIYQLKIACNKTKDPQLLLKLAKENIEQKKYQASIDPLNRALKLDPNNSEIKDLYKQTWNTLVTNDPTLKDSPSPYPKTNSVLLDEKNTALLALNTERKNQDLSNFFRYLEGAVKTQWQPVPQAHGAVVISAMISPEGTLSKEKIQRSSKIQDIDESAIQAISHISTNKPTGIDEPIQVDFIFVNGQKLLKIGFLPTPSFTNYMDSLQRHIKGHWFPPKGEESRKVVAVFKVNSEGKISNAQISKPSGSVLADAAALEAIAKSDPFEALPLGSPNQVDVEFTFDYNVHKNNEPQNARVLN